MGATDAEELLERGVQAAREAGFAATGPLVTALRKTSEIIRGTAEEQDAVSIVMGQRERSGLGTVILGSVAREVVALTTGRYCWSRPDRSDRTLEAAEEKLEGSRQPLAS